MSVQAAIRSRHFQHKIEKYLINGEIKIACLFCHAVHLIIDLAMVSLVLAPQFSEFCQKGVVALPSLHEPPPLLRHLLTAPDSLRKEFGGILRAYDSSPATGCTKADWVCRGSGNSSFKSTMTVHGRIYHYLGAKVPCSNP